MWIVSQQIYEMGKEEGKAEMQNQKDQQFILLLNESGKFSLSEIATMLGTTVDEVQRVLNEANAFVQSVTG